MLCNAVRIIVAHNHPSGDATPSKEDIDATKKIQKAGEIMDIELIDHIICGEDECISLAQQRYI
jgi:DNA repair protein RadC